jgi:predicted nucleotidyltransferase
MARQYNETLSAIAPMKYIPPTQKDGLRVAKEMKKRLLAAKIPVRQVLLFGSLARGESNKWTDIDIAIIHEAFMDDRFEEKMSIARERTNYDFPTDVICLRSEDLQNPYLGIAKEVKNHGIAV